MKLMATKLEKINELFKEFKEIEGDFNTQNTKYLSLKDKTHNFVKFILKDNDRLKAISRIGQPWIYVSTNDEYERIKDSWEHLKTCKEDLSRILNSIANQIQLEDEFKEKDEEQLVSKMISTKTSNNINYKVFLSYSTKDLETINMLKRVLGIEGVKIFLAEYSVAPGEKINEEIIKNLRECDLFIVLITKNSINSQYVQQEIGQAKAMNKKILPIITEPGVTPSGFISEIKYLDSSKEMNGSLLKLKEIIKDLKNQKQRGQIIGWGILLGLGLMALEDQE